MLPTCRLDHMRYFGNLVSVDLLNGVNGVVEFGDNLLALVTDGVISGYQHTPRRSKPQHLQFTPILQLGNTSQLESKTKATQPTHAGLD